MPGHFLKIQLSKKILDFLLDLKKEYKTYTKKQNFKPKIKSIINNLEDKLYTLESKLAHGAKICALEG